ncbi:MAG TPA: hypothetical protein VGM06_01160 [Polyangiaceae bacterium]
MRIDRVFLRPGVLAAAMCSWVACGGVDGAIGPGPSAPSDAAADADTPVDVDASAQADANVDRDAAPLSTWDGETCSLDITYAYGTNGGNVASRDRTTLTPPAAYLLTRTRDGGDSGPMSRACSATIGGCGEGIPQPSELAVLLADFHAVDVEAAFAAGNTGAPVLFGVDMRPVDGQVFVVERGDGRAFAVGSACGGASGCVPVPAGVATLVADLTALDQLELSTTACSNL